MTEPSREETVEASHEYVRFWFEQNLGFTAEETALMTVPMRTAIVRAITRARGDDDDGTAGVREPRAPRPDPVTPGIGYAPGTVSAVASGGNLVLTLVVDGQKIHDAILPHARRRISLSRGAGPAI